VVATKGEFIEPISLGRKVGGVSYTSSARLRESVGHRRVASSSSGVLAGGSTDDAVRAVRFFLRPSVLC
jgi:hypothetical protein